MDEKGLGERLQDARKHKRITQQELCQTSGLSYSTLAKIERGAIKSPSIFTVARVAESLGLSLDELMGLTTHPTKGKLVSQRGAKFVFFDVNGCLVQFTHHSFLRLANESGIPVDVIQGLYWEYNDSINRGEKDVEDLNTALSAALGMEVDWLDYYLETVEPIPGMADLLQWASERYKIGLLTNTMPGFVEALQAREKIPHVNFDVIIDSSVVGMVKPEPNIYQLAQERSGVEGGEILFVDDLSSNIVAAKPLGWHTIWFDPYRPEESIASIRLALEPAN
jgi:epoxide hydrolase-like predicted phosphatase